MYQMKSTCFIDISGGAHQKKTSDKFTLCCSYSGQMMVQFYCNQIDATKENWKSKYRLNINIPGFGVVWIGGHCNSSVSSAQSILPSQRSDIGIHLVISHVNSLAPHSGIGFWVVSIFSVIISSELI